MLKFAFFLSLFISVDEENLIYFVVLNLKLHYENGMR